MGAQPKVSVIIPVYNAEKYLRECLDSVVGQTLWDIEIICVDDNSTDTSPDILKEYAQKDNRFTIITNHENKTASQARKMGVLNSCGEYIWFVDADDMVKPEACEKLVALAAEKNVDILQFNTEIINTGKLSSDRVESYRRFLKPYPKMLEKRSVFEGCFKDHLYQFTIWNKLFSAELCKKAFAYVEDIPLPIAQDKYAFFLLSYFATSYYGTTEHYLYQYRLGAGSTAKNFLTKELHSRHCKMAWVEDAIERFLIGQGVVKKYQSILNESRDQLLKSCVGEWNYRSLSGDKAWGYDEMLQYWDVADVVGEIARLNWNNKFNIATALKNAKRLAMSVRKVKKIGVYYHHLSIGGAQKVVAQLIFLWEKLGYKCVLITDTPPGRYDYEIPEGVSRVIIPSYFHVNQDNYKKRAKAWKNIIQEYQIDTVVYHAWMANCSLWDIMVIKSSGASALVYCHGVFSMLLQPMAIFWGEMPEIFRLADGIVTLGKSDQRFWENFNARTFMVLNPMPFQVEEMESASLNSKNIVWVGRVSDEKRPYDAIEIIAQVVKEIPEAKLYIVGDSENKTDYLRDLKKRASQLGVENSIVFTGFKKDVQPYYLDASVFLMTSNYEGFSLTLLEAKSFGLPCVMYELPYLILAKDNRGILPVKMGDTVSASVEIVKLLNNTELRRSLGKQAKAHALELGTFNYEAAWKNIFDSLGKPCSLQSSEGTQAMWDVLLSHYRIGAEKRAREIYVLNKSMAEMGRVKQPEVVSNRMPSVAETHEENIRLNTEIQAIHSSWSYRMGRFITFIPRKVRGGIRCYQEHGMRYTLRRVKEKFLILLER